MQDQAGILTAHGLETFLTVELKSVPLIINFSTELTTVIKFKVSQSKNDAG